MPTNYVLLWGVTLVIILVLAVGLLWLSLWP
jgi:hypothetical protein